MKLGYCVLIFSLTVVLALPRSGSKGKSRGSSRGGGGGIARGHNLRAVNRVSPKVHPKPMGVIRPVKSQTQRGNFLSKVASFNGRKSKPIPQPKAQIKPGQVGTPVKQIGKELKKNPKVQPLAILKNIISKLSPKKEEVQKKKDKPSHGSGNIAKNSKSLAKTKSGKTKKNKSSEGGDLEKKMPKLKDNTKPKSKKTDKPNNGLLESKSKSKNKAEKNDKTSNGSKQEKDAKAKTLEKAMSKKADKPSDVDKDPNSKFKNKPEPQNPEAAGGGGSSVGLDFNLSLGASADLQIPAPSSGSPDVDPIPNNEANPTKADKNLDLKQEACKDKSKDKTKSSGGGKSDNDEYDNNDDNADDDDDKKDAQKKCDNHRNKPKVNRLKSQG